MRVEVLPDISKSVPAGYTYMRCDQLTAEEFVAECNGRFSKEAALAFVAENPKPFYNTDDMIRFGDYKADYVIKKYSENVQAAKSAESEDDDDDDSSCNFYLDEYLRDDYDPLDEITKNYDAALKFDQRMKRRHAKA